MKIIYDLRGHNIGFTQWPQGPRVAAMSPSHFLEAKLSPGVGCRSLRKSIFTDHMHREWALWWNLMVNAEYLLVTLVIILEVRRNLKHPAWLLTPRFLTDPLTPKARVPSSADKSLPHLSPRADMPLQSVPQVYKASLSQVNLWLFETWARRSPQGSGGPM